MGLQPAVGVARARGLTVVEGCPACETLRTLLRPSSVATPAGSITVQYVGVRPVETTVAPVTWTCANGHPVTGQ